MNLRLLLYSPLSKSYFQWGGGSSGEDVPWWLPSDFISQLVRIDLIRADMSLRECGGRSETTTTNKSGSGQGPYHPVIIGLIVPLSGVHRPDTVRPHRRSDGVGLNILGNLTQSVTAAFSHIRYAGIRNSEASLPLHWELTFNPVVGLDLGSSSLVLSVFPTHSFSLDLQHFHNSPCTKQIRACRELWVLLSREQNNIQQGRREPFSLLLI
jgi:hypothetical protein